MEAAVARPAFTPFERLAILVSVVTSASLFITTVMVASAVLPQMQGAMSATPDEIAWTMTFNILATAVAMPLTGWLVDRFGRRWVMLGSVFGFTTATIFCGSANSLEMLVLARIGQGALGAPLLPLAQAILLDTYPKRLHSFATAIYGMGIVLGPILGPGLGGYVAEIYSWRWAYYMIVPAGFVGFAGLWFTLPKDEISQEARVKLDWTGFLALSAAIACVQLVLSRGQRVDWYDSPEIVIETAIAVIAFYVFIAHSLTAKGAVPQSEPVAQSRLCARPLPGLDLRHAQLDAHGAPADIAAGSCGLPRRPHRLRALEPRRRRLARFFCRHVHEQGQSAGRDDDRLRGPDRFPASGS